MIEETTYEVDVIQYLLPNGEKRFIKTSLACGTEDDYLDMIKTGCRFEIEILRTNEVSVTIFDPKKDEDIAIEICKNGPVIQELMTKMLTSFNWEIYPDKQEQDNRYNHP